MLGFAGFSGMITPTCFEAYLELLPGLLAAVAVRIWTTANLRLLESKHGKGKYAEELAQLPTLTNEPDVIDLGGTGSRRFVVVEVGSSVRTNRDYYVQLFASVKSPAYHPSGSSTWWHEICLAVTGTVCHAYLTAVTKFRCVVPFDASTHVLVRCLCCCAR